MSPFLFETHDTVYRLFLLFIPYRGVFVIIYALCDSKLYTRAVWQAQAPAPALARYQAKIFRCLNTKFVTKRSKFEVFSNKIVIFLATQSHSAL